MIQEKQELLEEYERKSMTQRMSVKSLSVELKLVPEETESTHHDLLDIKKDFGDLNTAY